MPMIQTDSQHYSDIADAIRAKNGSQTTYYPADMATAISNIPTGIPDNYIFKEGYGYNVRLFNGTSPTVSGSGWTVNAFNLASISASYYNNSTIRFKIPIDKNVYSKVKIEVAVTSGASGNYNTSSIGLVTTSASDNSNPSYNGPAIYFINYGDQTNYTGTTPWYTMPRTIITLDASTFSQQYYHIKLHKCDDTPYIYNLWLEP